MIKEFKPSQTLGFEKIIEKYLVVNLENYEDVYISVPIQTIAILVNNNEIICVKNSGKYDARDYQIDTIYYINTSLASNTFTLWIDKPITGKTYNNELVSFIFSLDIVIDLSLINDKGLALFKYNDISSKAFESFLTHFLYSNHKTIINDIKLIINNYNHYDLSKELENIINNFYISYFKEYGIEIKNVNLFNLNVDNTSDFKMIFDKK